MNHETEFSNGEKITDFLASAYAEGFCEGEGASVTDQLKAWSYLIGTGLCFSLQGWYGRTAHSLMNNGVIDNTGKVNWAAVEVETGC